MPFASWFTNSDLDLVCFHLQSPSHELIPAKQQELQQLTLTQQAINSHEPQALAVELRASANATLAAAYTGYVCVALIIADGVI